MLLKVGDVVFLNEEVHLQNRLKGTVTDVNSNDLVIMWYDEPEVPWIYTIKEATLRFPKISKLDTMLEELQNEISSPIKS